MRYPAQPDRVTLFRSAAIQLGVPNLLEIVRQSPEADRAILFLSYSLQKSEFKERFAQRCGTFFETNARGENLLWMALRLDELPAMQQLERGFPLEARRGLANILNDALERPLRYALRCSKFPLVKRLLGHWGADPLLMMDASVDESLLLGALRGANTEVIHFLDDHLDAAERKRLVDMQNKGGGTLLQLCTGHPYLRPLFVRFLEVWKADPFLADK